jgi:hypothetical protein
MWLPSPIVLKHARVLRPHPPYSIGIFSQHCHLILYEFVQPTPSIRRFSVPKQRMNQQLKARGNITILEN